jgi:Ca2+ transporting ATPase
MDAPWALSAQDILQHFGSDEKHGLIEAKVQKHRELYGRNGMATLCHVRAFAVLTRLEIELPEEPPTPIWELILDQFKDQLVLILLGSAVVSFVLALLEDNSEGGLLSAFVEPSVILLILIANATVGVIQETNAEKAIDVSPPTAVFGFLEALVYCRRDTRCLIMPSFGDVEHVVIRGCACLV